MKRTLGVILIMLCAAWTAKADWQLQTNHANLNLFEQYESAELHIRWAGDQDNAPTQTPAFALFDMLGNKLLDMASTALVDGKASISLPSDKLGYFELRAMGQDAGAIIPSKGSRPAGMMTYAVVAKIKPDPSYQWTQWYLGMQGTTILGNGHPLGWDAYPYLGIQTAGLGYHWNRFEAKGPEDFEPMAARDQYPQVIREMKIYPNFQLSGFPIWAVDQDRLPEEQRKYRGTTRLPPKDYAEYEAFLRRMVTHIRDNYSQLPHRTYEILWEPCIPWGWYGTVDEIVKVFEVAHRVIHEVDPNGLVAGPTLSGLNDTEYLEKLLKAGLGNYLDVQSCHPYKGYPPEKTSVEQGIGEAKRIVAKYVGKDIPFMGTEFGFTDGVAGGVLNHSYGITTSLIIYKAGGADTHTIFYLGDYAGEPGYGFFYNLVKGQPFGPKYISPKPAVPMIRACIDQIGNAKFVGKLDYLGSDFWGYIFEDCSTHELVAALWDASDRDRTLVFDAGVDKVNQVDGMGNIQAVQTRGGLLELKLTRMPMYIRNISAKMYGPNRIKPLLHTKPNWTITRGKPLDIDIEFSRQLTDKPVTLTFDTDANISQQQFRKTFTMQVDKPMTISLPIAANAPLGPNVGYLRLTAGGKTIWKAVQHLEVAPELSFGPITTQRNDHTWQINQTITNVSAIDWQGTLSMHVDEQVIEQREIQIPAGKQMQLASPLPTGIVSTRVHQVKNSFHSRFGTQLQSQGDVTCMVVSRVKPNDPWGQLQMVDLLPDEKNLWKDHPETSFGGQDDLSAQMGYGYDEHFVYVQALVRDDVHRCDTRSGTTWDQDSLQLDFDVLPWRQANSNLLAEKNERTNSDICLALTPRGPEVYAHLLPGASPLSQGLLKQGKDCQLDVKRVDGITQYRLKIAWDILDPLGKRDGKQLGIAAAINDSDLQGRFNTRVALLLFDGIVSGGKNPQRYGKAKLLDQ
ncbi:MAG: hypothetical protein ACF8OB_05970 [Phycisphaeraceae bacterium JB051]